LPVYTPVTSAPGGRLGLQAMMPPVPHEPDPGRFLKAMLRRWPLVLGVGSVLAIVAGATAWYTLGARYTAFALVHVAATPPKVVGLSAAEIAEARNDFNTFQRTQAARIKSRYVLNAVLKRDDVKRLGLDRREPDPNALAAWLEDEIKVEFKEGSEILTVSMTGSDPEEVRVLVGAVTQAYLQEIVNAESKSRAARIADVDAIFNDSKEKLREKRNEVRRLSEQLGTSDSQALTEKQVMLLTTLRELKKQHIQIRFDLMKAQGRAATVKGRSRTPSQALAESALDKAMENDPIAKDYLATIGKLKAIIRDYELTAMRSDESSLLTARRKVQSLQKELQARREELAEELKGRLAKATQLEAEASAGEVEDEVAALAAHEKSLAGEVDKGTHEVSKIGNSSTEIAMLRDDIRQEEKLTDNIGQQLESLRYELRSPARVSLYQEAALQRRDFKRQLLAATLAPLGAFFCVGLCVSWLEGRSRRLHTVQEVAGLGLRVVGSVPVLPAAGRRRLVAGADEQQVYGPTFLESIDAIRTLLLRDAHMDGSKVLMITSAVEGEGKTTLASHLATSLARAGRKTLLIDCDLRRPILQEVFNIPLQPGVSEVLLGQADVAKAVRTSADGPDVLTAGQWDREVLRVLARDGANKVLDPMKQAYDFILIDSHPVMTAADSLLIGQHADAVIFSLLRHRSQIPMVYAACERLAGLGIRVMGAVVNGIDQAAMYDDFGQSLPRYPRP
jgi:capsular exopolysaccharide synthesis family protein